MPYSSPRAVLSGLDPILTQELTFALRELAIEVVSPDRLDADFVFCRPRAVESERQNRPSVPVIAVSRRQDVAEWLDAIEAGAYDYCAAPFELVNLGWILQSSGRPSVHRAA